ncbi:MAG TPA: ethanolamine utilization protein EutJ [Desulfobacteraceae bacterium]|nr:ethanolamine utilization protein EutJ [Desulfobacteraceae bacterium]
MRILFNYFFLVSLLVPPLVTLSAYAPAYAAKPVKVAAIYAMSGEAVAISFDHLLAVRIALEEINAAGGVLGRPIKLIELDNQSTALGSRKAAIEAVNMEVAAVVGGPWSSHAISMAKVLQPAKIPMISPIATNPKVTRIGEYIFRTCFIDAYQGQMLAQFAYEDLDATTVAVLTNVDQVYAIDLSEEFIKKFSALGGRVSARIDYIENLTHYGDLITELSQHEFDAVILPGYTRDSAQIIKAARKMGISTPVIGGDGWSPLMRNYAREELENCYYLTHWHKDLKNDKSVAFTQKAMEKLGQKSVMSGMALAYDSMYLLADAMRRAGTTEAKKLRDALANTRDFTGVTGRIVYDRHRNPVKPAVILKFENGDFTLFKQTIPGR